IWFRVDFGGPIARYVCSSCHGRVGFPPKDRRDREGIDLLVLPPGTLVALLMEFSVMQPAHGNREPVADFSAHRPLLCKLDMVGIRWGSAADKAGLRGHKLQVVTVALRRWLADDDDRVFTSIDMQRVIVTAIRLPR